MWRNGGFFVPALWSERFGYDVGELYGLSDVVTVKVLRLLLDVGVDREVVTSVGEHLPVVEVGTLLNCREVATMNQWAVAPKGWYGLDMLDVKSVRFFSGDAWVAFRSTWEIDAVGERVSMLGGDGQVFAVGVALSQVAAEIVSKADAWRRQRRIKLEYWPPWM